MIHVLVSFRSRTPRGRANETAAEKRRFAMSADIPTKTIPAIPATATAVLLSAPGIVDVTEVGLRPPLPDELLVRVEAAGICGSDVELFAGNRPAELVRYPVIPGHEWSGRVAAVGSRVDGFT